jgi:hypothetical protein
VHVSGLPRSSYSSWMPFTSASGICNAPAPRRADGPAGQSAAPRGTWDRMSGRPTPANVLTMESVAPGT